jgi:stage V sporulation protein B
VTRDAETKLSRVFDVAAQFLSSVAGRGLYLALQVFLARQLGPFEFGLYCIGWTVIGLTGTLTTVGMPQAVLRYGIGGRASLVAPPVLIAAGVGLAATVLVAALADRIATGLFGEPDAGPVIRAFAPAVLTLGLGGVMASSLRVTRALALSALAGAALFALSLGLTLVAFTVWASATSAAAMYSVAAALTLIGTAVLLHAQPSTTGAPALRALARFGVITMFIHGSNVLNIWADRLVIGILSDAEAVGVYQAASQFAMIAVVLRSAVVTVFEAKVPKRRPEGGPPPDVTREYVAAVRTLLHATGPGLVAFGLTAGFWVGLLFGPAYAAGAAPLVTLLAGQVLQTLLGPSVNALHMTGDERMVLALTFGGMALNVAGNFALIPLIGTAGAALATVIANNAVCAVCLARLVRSGRLRASIASFGDLLLGVGAAALTAGALLYAFGPPSVPLACLAALAAYAAHFAVVTATCQTEDDMLGLLRAGAARLASTVKRRRGADDGGAAAEQPLAARGGSR